MTEFLVWWLFYGTSGPAVLKRYFTDLLASESRYYDLGDGFTLTGDFEIEFNFTKTTASQFGRILESDNSFSRIFQNGAGNTLTARISGDTTEFLPVPSVVITDGKVHTGVLKRSGDDYTLSVDGVSSSTQTVSGVIWSLSTLGATSGMTNLWDGILADVKIWINGDRATGTLVGDYPLDENWTQGNVARNRVAVLGSEEWVEPFTLSGSDWIDNADGTFSRTGTTSGEVRKELSGYNDGDVVRVSFTSAGSSPVTIQFGGPPTDGKNRVQSTPAGDHVYILTAESFSTNNNMRFISTGSDLTISNISVKQIPSATPYATAVNITSDDATERRRDNSFSPNRWVNVNDANDYIEIAGT